MRILTFFAAVLVAGAAEHNYDIVVYGSTPAGIASAVVAARQGHRVALIEPTTHVGGLLTGGLSYTDFRTRESLSGFFLEYTERVLGYYVKKYGAESTQVKDCYFGAHAEPHVSMLILDGMIAEQTTLSLHRGWRLRTASTAVQPKGMRSVKAASFDSAQGSERVEGRFWIDATYEGDLASAVKVPYRLGRESTREYGERYAGVIYFEQGRIL
ncbi:MAG: FAD-dependent oxidoreductase, partial [Bryobacteraceae bacterium]|nr:FAD-dependent oxidoreductase [Bryobacteraceae bacterium]